MKYNIAPCTKPRMTKSDAWKKRPCVLKYWAFKDEVNLAGVTFENYQAVIFRVKMPKTWSEKKKAKHAGMPHLATPDADNLLKALMDAIYENDSHLWHPWAIKVWSYESSIEILHINEAMLFIMQTEKNKESK